MRKPKDAIDRVLAVSRKRDVIDRAIATLTISRREIVAAGKAVRGINDHDTYARRRVGCVITEIDAALRGLRCARGNLSRSITLIARSAK